MGVHLGQLLLRGRHARVVENEQLTKLLCVSAVVVRLQLVGEHGMQKAWECILFFEWG